MSGIVGSKLNIRGSGLVGSSGTDGQYLLSSGAGKTNVFETVVAATTDLSGVNSDITALALREATNESSAAFNLPNKFIETFTDDTNLGTQTTGDRTSGYWSTIIAGVGIDANTVYLLSLNNNLTDTSGNSITTTNNGSATFSTSVKKFGTHSALFNGSNQWLSTGNLSTGLTNAFPTTGDFTVDFWAAYIAQSGTDRIFAIGNNGAGGAGSGPVVSCGIQDATHFNCQGGDGPNFTPNESFAINATWEAMRHYAIQRTGTTLYVWIDGAVLANDTYPTGWNGLNLMTNDDNVQIGIRSGSATEFFNGYVDEFRISNTSRYTGGSAFTPPSTAYTGTVTSATGTLIQSANTVASAKTKVGGTMLYKDNAGTATLGTDLKIYFTCNGDAGSPAWTEAASYNAITPVYSTGIKQVRLGETTCTSGTDIRYKAVWANQSGSKETQLHGIGVNY